jgi:hypothetical protein
LFTVVKVTRKEFKFAAKHNLPFFFVSAADGTNIVKVFSVFKWKTCPHWKASFQVFQSAILEAKRYKAGGGDALSEMFDLLNDSVSVD